MSVVELIMSASLAAKLSQRSSLTCPRIREPGILINKVLVSNSKKAPKWRLFQPVYRPASALSASARSTFSQLRSRSSRPKCP